MKIPFYLIEVYNDPNTGMRGNIAAVLHLENELSSAKMLEIAEDLAQPATSFMLKNPDDPGNFKIRWFAPISEIDLCGHGSLAAIASLQGQIALEEKITLEYPKGKIQANLLELNLGSINIEGIQIKKENKDTEKLESALGQKIMEHYFTNNKDIVVLENEKAVKLMTPNFEALRKLPSFGYSVTAKGDQSDFVSRTIIPFVPILEDQATGSSHASLSPFWSKRLNKRDLIALQLSKRGGKFVVHVNENLVSLKGCFTILSKGEISI